MSRIMLYFLWMLSLLTTSLSATTYYVNGENGDNLWDGTSPTHEGGNIGPKKTICAGVNLTEDGDEVVVADGTYSGDNNLNFDDALDNGFITLRSENGPDECIISCLGSGVLPLDFRQTPPSPVIRGFTFQNAGNTVIHCGNETKVAIDDCIFFNNSFPSNRGVIHCELLSEPVITGCTLKNNFNTDSGATIFAAGNTIITIDNCSIHDNWTSQKGAGIMCQQNACLIIMNSIINNNSAQIGGGIYCEDMQQQGRLRLHNSILESNLASNEGGGIYWNDSDAVINLTNCIISNNEADNGDVGGDGGGIVCGSVRSVSVSNCTIIGNIGNATGGGIKLGSGGAGLINNSIIRSNQPVQIEASGALINYSNIEGTIPPEFQGHGIIDADPCFADVDDYHLKSTAGRYDSDTDQWIMDAVDSPCIDSGDPGDPVGNEPDGNGERINMGAYGATAEASKTEFVPDPIVGDINLDDIVDLIDLSSLAAHWLESQ